MSYYMFITHITSSPSFSAKGCSVQYQQGMEMLRRKLTFDGVLLPLPGLLVFPDPIPSSSRSPEGTANGVETCAVAAVGGVILVDPDNEPSADEAVIAGRSGR